MRHSRSLTAALLLHAALFLLPRDLHASTCTWDGSSADWTTAHWGARGTPGASDTVIINSGTVTLSTSHSVTGLTFTGGVIDGAGDLGVSGIFSWTGGTMSGSGTTTIAATSTLTINSGAVGLARHLINNGTVTWVSGQIQDNGATIDNNATFTAQPQRVQPRPLRTLGEEET